MYAIGTSIISSVGMKKLFELAIPGEGKLKYFLMNVKITIFFSYYFFSYLQIFLNISPYTGCAFASLCNLYFARVKDLKFLID